MNIQKLLNKLERKSIESKRDLIVNKGPYKIRTSESIGTLNSVADSQERSFVINEPAKTPINNKLKQKLEYSETSEQSKLDKELSSIEKMKERYESKSKLSRRQNRSFEKNEKSSAGKSSEKHLLKPSNTPSFHKVCKLPPDASRNSSCKNLNSQNMLEIEQPSKSQINAKRPVYQHSSIKSQREQHQELPYEESEQSYDGDIQSIQQHNGNIPNTAGIPDQSSINIHNDLSELSAENYHPKKDSKPLKISADLPKCQCNCQQMIRELANNYDEKINLIFSQVHSLEQENRMLKERQDNLEQINKQYRNEVNDLADEGERRQEELQKYREEKEELEVMLKDVLYKREREKLQSSKENTHRENREIDKKMTGHQYSNSYGNKQEHQRSKNQHKSIDSKMKVQSLLQKLQIKVDRV